MSSQTAFRPKPTYPSLPRFRQSHVLAQGLIGAWLTSDGYDRNTNNGVDQRHNGAFAWSTLPTWLNTPYGWGLNFVGASAVNCGTFVGPQSGYTAIALSIIPTLSQAMQLFSAFNNNAASYSQFTVLSTGQYECRILKWGGSSYTFIGRHSNTGIYTAGNWHHSAYTWDGGTTNASIKVYQDGARVDTSDNGSGTFTGPDTNAVEFDIGAQKSGSYDSSSGLKGQIAGVWQYNRALTADEIALHLQDPFAMFRRSALILRAAPKPISQAIIIT